MSGGTVLPVGGTSGIGLELSRTIVSRGDVGATVFLLNNRGLSGATMHVSRTALTT